MWSHFPSVFQGALLLTLCLVALPLRAQPFTVTIEAGDVERRESIATFRLPEYFGPTVTEGHLVDAKGNAYRFQVIGEEAKLILPRLATGKMLELSYAPNRLGNSKSITPHSAGIAVTNVGGRYVFLSGNRRLFEYQAERSAPPTEEFRQFAHAGYLHRVFSPSGKLVTADYPPDHPHQRGIFFAWTKTEHEYRDYTGFDQQTGSSVITTNVAHPDFWNMGKDNSGQLTGEVQARSARVRFAGPVVSRLNAEHWFVSHEWRVQKTRRMVQESSGWLGVDSTEHANPGSLTGRAIQPPQPGFPPGPLPEEQSLFTNDYAATILKETWQVDAYAAGLSGQSGFLCFDLTSSQNNCYPAPLRLPKYHYGGLGVRGSAQWDPVDKVTMFTSNGDDRLKGDATKAKWVWMGGEVDGAMTGILVLIHPQNFRFPQPLRLNPKNPQLCVAPSAEGDWEIKPGETYVSRYRFVVMDGKPTAAEAERFWQDYANPVKVTVK
jgi:hypothetical protein